MNTSVIQEAAGNRFAELPADGAAEGTPVPEALRAALNILEDFDEERSDLKQIMAATFNILDDFSDDKRRLESVQRTAFNILEDLYDEKKKVQGISTHLEEMVAARTAELQKSNEILAAANKELETFAYSVSHDLLTPLRAVDGFSRILVDEYADKLGDEGQRVVTTVRAGAQKMGRLIDDILGYINLGRRQLVLNEIDMESLVERCWAKLNPIGSTRDLTLNVGPLLPCRADGSMLESVWSALLDNAVKFTGRRPKAVIGVGSRVIGNEAVYYVKDNGVGFDMAYADKLFGVFQRLYGPGEFDGTGIGLAVVKRIVNRHGGRVWAEGKLDRGATFYFSLPLVEKSHV